MSQRLSYCEYLLEIAITVALRSTCCLRSVGAVVADSHNFVRGTGYNGPPSTLPHCSTKKPCDAAVLELTAPATYQHCVAVHAEVNALLIAGKAATQNGTLAVTVQPCRECAKLIVNAGIKLVVCGEEHRLYQHGAAWPAARILQHAGIKMVLIP